MGNRSRIRPFAPLTIAAGLMAVQSGAVGAQSTPPGTDAAAGASAGMPVVEVIAEDHAFSAPDEIPSGWTTLRLRNEGEETHFALLSRLPEGRTVDDYVEDVAVHFDDAVRAVRVGDMDGVAAREGLAGVIPMWFASLQRKGGPGLVTGGGTSEVILDLEPGNYFLECYMKTEEGEFHAMEGMIRPLTVTAEASGTAEPEADIRMTLSNDGIAIQGQLTSGRHTMAVHFAEQPEAGDPHDVHLARLDGATVISDVVPWMDWLAAHGLRSPAPIEFRGGTHEMAAGSTVYITVDLEPGRYAWISQMTAAQGILKEFTLK